MTEYDKSKYHRIYGESKRRIVYKKTDVFDYALMSLLCAVVVWFSYGRDNPITYVGIAAALWMLVAFPVRHGWAPAVPLVVRRPQEVLYSILYKVENLKWVYFFGIAVLLLENYLIRITPTWPHHVELMRKIALWLFYLHFGAITAYRTYIYYAHLRKRALVREVLLQTVWKKNIEQQRSMAVEITHAYLTGILTHIILIAPWYIVITHFDFSVLFVVATLAINFFTQSQHLKLLNAWYYRDHWLSHNSEFDFIYLHGSHHDAIPSGLIGVAGNGHLEGFTRHGLGAPIPFYNPLMAMFIYNLEIKGDIDAHQYIPGVFPGADINRQTVAQHSMHHFGRLKPYSFGMGADKPGANEDYVRKLKYLPEELKNSIRIDEELDDFEWNSKMHADYLKLVEKYEGPQ